MHQTSCDISPPNFFDTSVVEIFLEPFQIHLYTPVRVSGFRMHQGVVQALCPAEAMHVQAAAPNAVVESPLGFSLSMKKLSQESQTVSTCMTAGAFHHEWTCVHLKTGEVVHSALVDCELQLLFLEEAVRDTPFRRVFPGTRRIPCRSSCWFSRIKRRNGVLALTPGSDLLADSTSLVEKSSSPVSAHGANDFSPT